MTKDKKMITDEKEMAGVLNNFFASVYTKENMADVPDAAQEEILFKMKPIKITQQEIRTKIRKLRKEAAAGPDGVKPSLLQQLESSFLAPLEILFKRSISMGEIPTDWRAAHVTPIFKKGSKGDPGNYRPVSLTSVPCKILETIIKDKVMEHLLKNNLIRNSQHGFMPGRSCATNLVQFMDKISKAVDEGDSVDILYLDFAKAFDKVPHKRLISKLKGKGIEEGVVRWIESWLTDRTQKVCIQGEKSDTCAVESGVPQGTVLGPILFSVYIDDLEVEVERLQLEVIIAKFADDTKGAKIIRGPEDREKLQTALDCLCAWAHKWGMSFNVAKCKVLHVGRNNPQYEYYMDGMKLGVTEVEKDVGVMVAKSLKPSEQCEAAAGRATSVLYQIRRNFHYRDRSTFVRLYTQYARPHLEFSVPAWSHWLKGDIERLESVQEKAVKMVAGLQGKSYKESCVELGLETLENRRRDQDMNLVFKLLREGGSDMFTMTGEREGARTRQAAGPRTLAGQYARTDIRKYSFAVRVVDDWNQLPDKLRGAQSQESFKRGLKSLRESEKAGQAS